LDCKLVNASPEAMLNIEGLGAISDTREQTAAMAEAAFSSNKCRGSLIDDDL
jgi:hypothetical protein